MVGNYAIIKVLQGFVESSDQKSANITPTRSNESSKADSTTGKLLVIPVVQCGQLCLISYFAFI